jgi:hypothetical protein
MGLQQVALAQDYSSFLTDRFGVNLPLDRPAVRVGRGNQSTDARNRALPWGEKPPYRRKFNSSRTVAGVAVIVCDGNKLPTPLHEPVLLAKMETTLLIRGAPLNTTTSAST